MRNLIIFILICVSTQLIHMNHQRRFLFDETTFYFIWINLTLPQMFHLGDFIQLTG